MELITLKGRIVLMVLILEIALVLAFYCGYIYSNRNIASCKIGSLLIVYPENNPYYNLPIEELIKISTAIENREYKYANDLLLKSIEQARDNALIRYNLLEITEKIKISNALQATEYLFKH